MTKNVIKSTKIYQLLMYWYNLLRGEYWKFFALHYPIKNARSEMKRQQQSNLIRDVQLDNPIYFNEKMLWLKYYIYNRSSLISQCYNKYLVREYVNNKGLSCILNELFYATESIESLPWNELPEECVIKYSNGYYGHVFKRKGEVFDINNAKNTLLSTVKRCNYAFKISGDLFAYQTKPYYICEKLIHSDNKNYTLPEDYKFHCFNGQPLFLESIYDRNYENKDSFYHSTFIDIKNMKDRHDLEGSASPVNEIILPKSFSSMLKYAEILSEDFPYVRVDFYESEGRPIFGELTFTPYHMQTKNSLIELGNLLSFKDIERYKNILVNY